jgi:hypothetical protein
MSVNKQAVIAASVVTAIAGLLHLFLASQLLSLLTAPKIMVFFLIAGLLQLFWVIPTIKRWNIFWNYIGIVGTMILIGMWVYTRFPNLITTRSLPVNPIGIIVEGLQVAFIVFLFIVLQKRKNSKKELAENKI